MQSWVYLNMANFTMDNTSLTMSNISNVTMEIFNTDNFTNSTSSIVHKTDTSSVSSVILLILFLLILLPNIVVLFLLTNSQVIRNNRRIDFILWLCISDLVCAVAVFMFFLTNIDPNLSTNKTFCSINMHFIVTSLGQTLTHILLICVDRFLGVIRNQLYQKLRRCYRYAFIGASCLIVHINSGVLEILFYPNEDRIEVCSMEALYGAENTRTMFVYLSIFYFVMFLPIPFLYIGILSALR